MFGRDRFQPSHNARVLGVEGIRFVGLRRATQTRKVPVQQRQAVRFAQVVLDVALARLAETSENVAARRSRALLRANSSYACMRQRVVRAPLGVGHDHAVVRDHGASLERTRVPRA